MSFQTVFYEKATGKIITTTPNKYIKSKFEKARFCPGYTPDEINFLYFPSTIPINPTEYHVQHISPTRPPLLVEQGGIPLVYTDKREKFVETKARYQTIIINMADSMGDNLFRAAAVIEAQKKYPGTRFLCKVQPPYKEVMALCPEITLFSDYKTHNLKPQECGTIDMDGGTLADPRGLNYSKASLYGLFLNLSFAPNNVKLNPPPDPDFLLAEWVHNIGIREDGHNIVFGFRTKNWEGKSWDNSMAIELARMIKTVYDCNVFYLGADIDMTESTPEIINLAGKTTWLQTVYILTRASHVFCIDSGVLHLCRALNIPYFCLWGETHPRQILGEDPGPQDIGAQFETSKGNIKAITPLQVFTRAFPTARAEFPLIYNPTENTSQHGDQKEQQVEDSLEVSIVILCYNSLDYTKKCIESIRKNTAIPYRLVLLDNGSTDGTLQYLQSTITQRDIIIRLSENIGFGPGNNLAMKSITTEYVCFLNNDCEVGQGWITSLLEAGRTGNLIGTSMNYLEPNHKEKRFYHVGTKKTDWGYLEGWCLLIRKGLFESIGGFDEQFIPALSEDADLCFKAKKSGAGLQIISGLKVIHHKNKTISQIANLSQIATKNNTLLYNKWIKSEGLDELKKGFP